MGGGREKGITEDFLEEVTFEVRMERHVVNSQVKDNREKQENGTSRGEYSQTLHRERVAHR